jgi:hypothetical protein
MNIEIICPGILDTERFVVEMNIGTEAKPITRLFSARLVTCRHDGEIPSVVHQMQAKSAFDNLINMINQGSNLPGLDVFGAVWKTGEAFHLSSLKKTFARFGLTTLEGIPILAGNPISGEGYYYMPNLQNDVLSVSLASKLLRSIFFFLAVRQEDEVAP